ncbi:MAG: biopolymer transporter ExbD [Puniceicoccales bacterium]|jgi:biopolymer transport protein ExbD|nr:biopolymer transporter ExbD [Puniceicoccales bacterium]
MSLYRPRKRRNDINIVPLIDVMTALIFFFLMSMRFDDVQALSIVPPTAESAGKDKSQSGSVLSVNKAGVFYINGQAATRTALMEHLKKEGEKSPRNSILIVADEETFTKDTVFLVDQANKANLVPRLVTRPLR